MLRTELLDAKRHDRESFSCGEPSLDTYLQRQASQHHRDGISTTHVLVDSTQASHILGYYSLSAAQLLLTQLQAEDRKRLPNYPVPVIRMGRLAVASNQQGRGYGEYLLASAVKRCLELRKELGIRALVVDALNPKAAGFYRAYGFRDASGDSSVLYLPLGKVG